VDSLGRDSPASENNLAAALRAANDAVQLLADRGKGTGGLILLDRSGTPAFAFNTPRMAYGFAKPDGTFVTSV
jgi:isoaspartyl peptidase/L-asparaginase-like protein (Ntn-hydrolase superfamily)